LARADPESTAQSCGFRYPFIDHPGFRVRPDGRPGM